MKKIISLILCGAICLPLVACSSKQGSEEFATYTKTLPNELVKHYGYDLNFTFDNPEKYGIKKDLYTLDFITFKDYQNENEANEKITDKLKDYDYDELTKDQKITYDLLKEGSEAYDHGVDLEDEYYLTTNYFDITSGIQANLLTSLWNYEIKNQKSLDSFIAVLKQAPTIFKKYTGLEATRQKKGYGMSKTYMKDVLDALKAINSSDQSYVLEAIFPQIDKAKFIAEDKKQAYKEEIQTAFDESLLPAFKQAEKDLSEIKILKKGEGELASYEGGKEYYKKIVTDTANVSSMKEYTKFLDKQEELIQKHLFALFSEYPELAPLLQDSDALNKAISEPHFTDLTTSEEVIAFLEDKIANGKDYPKIKKLDYKMNIVPEAMRETLPFVAAYFVSPLDNLSGTNEKMLLNDDFTQASFISIAHESFPGHMYQNNYFKTVKHNIVRDLLGDLTYVEGWATYIQGEACNYSQNPGVCKLSNINDQFSYVYVLRLDKAIHYDGYTRKEAYDYLKENFGTPDDEACAAIYEQLLGSPTAYANYYNGFFKIMDYKTQAKKKWGDKYSDYRFHKALLDLGELPMNLVEKYLNL